MGTAQQVWVRHRTGTQITGWGKAPKIWNIPLLRTVTHRRYDEQDAYVREVETPAVACLGR